MNTGSWVLLMLAAVVTFGYGGYLIGRRNSEQQREVDRLEQELDAARARAEQVKASVDTHFEQSAVLFGQLARDYRHFLDHFQSSARELGLSEGRAGELLDQVAHPLLAQPSEAGMDAQPGSPPDASADTAPSEAAGSEQPSPAGQPASGDGSGDQLSPEPSRQARDDGSTATASSADGAGTETATDAATQGPHVEAGDAAETTAPRHPPSTGAAT